MSNVINKKDLAEKLAEEFGCSKKDATAYVQFVFDTVADTLKDNGIMAYGQDLGDAGFAAVRYGMGRGIDDRVAIIVASDKADSAKQVIKEMGLELR